MGNKYFLQMSDVEAGGATVFPNAGAQVLPEKVRQLFLGQFSRETLCGGPFIKTTRQRRQIINHLGSLFITSTEGHRPN